jgi:hypothetical protein
MQRRPGLKAPLAVPVAMLAAIILAPPAAATGTLFCSIDDQNVRFELLGSTRIPDGTIVEVHKGSLTLKTSPGVTKAPSFPITKDDIMMQWTLDRDLRFAIRVDDPDNARSIVLAIIAVRNEKLEKYLGRYELQFAGAKPAKALSGKIKNCEGD